MWKLFAPLPISFIYLLLFATFNDSDHQTRFNIRRDYLNKFKKAVFKGWFNSLWEKSYPTQSGHLRKTNFSSKPKNWLCWRKQILTSTICDSRGILAHSLFNVLLQLQWGGLSMNSVFEVTHHLNWIQRVYFSFLGKLLSSCIAKVCLGWSPVPMTGHSPARFSGRGQNEWLHQLWSRGNKKAQKT